MQSISIESELLWKQIFQNNICFEQSMESLYRKQTESYYTSPKLPLVMMQELVDSLGDETKKNSLF